MIDSQNEVFWSRLIHGQGTGFPLNIGSCFWARSHCLATQLAHWLSALCHNSSAVLDIEELPIAVDVISLMIFDSTSPHYYSSRPDPEPMTCALFPSRSCGSWSHRCADTGRPRKQNSSYFRALRCKIHKGWKKAKTATCGTGMVGGTCCKWLGKYIRYNTQFNVLHIW